MTAEIIPLPTAIFARLPPKRARTEYSHSRGQVMARDGNGTICLTPPQLRSRTRFIRDALLIAADLDDREMYDVWSAQRADLRWATHAARKWQAENEVKS